MLYLLGTSTMNQTSLTVKKGHIARSSINQSSSSSTDISIYLFGGYKTLYLLYMNWWIQTCLWRTWMLWGILHWSPPTNGWVSKRCISGTHLFTNSCPHLLYLLQISWWLWVCRGGRAFRKIFLPTSFHQTLLLQSTVLFRWRLQLCHHQQLWHLFPRWRWATLSFGSSFFHGWRWVLVISDKCCWWVVMNDAS